VWSGIHCIRYNQINGCHSYIFLYGSNPSLTGDNIWRYNPRNIIPDGLIRWIVVFTFLLFKLAILLNLLRFSSLSSSHSISFINYWKYMDFWFVDFQFFVLNALFYLYAIAKQEFDENTASRAVFYIAAAPAAFFFSTVYTESIFLLFVVACFYYSRNRKWLFAAIAGALASVTRLSGVLVGVFILFEALWQQNIHFVPKPWKLEAQFVLIKNDVKILPKAWIGILASIFSTRPNRLYDLFESEVWGSTRVSSCRKKLEQNDQLGLVS